VQRDEIKARLPSLPDRYTVAIDKLIDTEVAELSAALRRLHLEPGGALIPRKGETVIGCSGSRLPRHLPTRWMREETRATVQLRGGARWAAYPRQNPRTTTFASGT
jgi:hypothetical protein